MQVCVWDKAASSQYNEKKIKIKSLKCFIFWDPSLVLTAALIKFQVEQNLQFTLNILVALAQSVTSLSPPFPWIVQSQEEEFYAQKPSVLAGNECTSSHQDPHSFKSSIHGD